MQGEPGTEDDLAARTVEEEVPVALRSELCLDAAQVDTLTTLSLRVEESFGQPQDIEWAFAGAQLFMLQARPITTPVDIESWRKRGDVARIDRARIVWSNVNVGEALPGVATPLTWSILSSFSELGFRRAFGSLGCSVPRDAELVGEFRGRIYLNLTEFMSILSQVPGLRPKTLLALGGGGMGDRLETDIVPRSRAAFFARLPVTAARYARENYNITERVRAFESFYESERRRIESVDPALLSPASMAALLRDVEHLLDEAGAVMLTVYGNLLASVVLLQGVLALVVSEQADTVQRDLLGGLADVEHHAAHLRAPPAGRHEEAHRAGVGRSGGRPRGGGQPTRPRGHRRGRGPTPVRAGRRRTRRQGGAPVRVSAQLRAHGQLGRVHRRHLRRGHRARGQRGARRHLRQLTAAQGSAVPPRPRYALSQSAGGSSVSSISPVPLATLGRRSAAQCSMVRRAVTTRPSGAVARVGPP